jgi:hypothetical protein
MENRRQNGMADPDCACASNPFGIDVTRIDEYSRFTPTEWWERHARALAFVEELRDVPRARPTDCG